MNWTDKLSGMNPDEQTLAFHAVGVFPHLNALHVLESYRKCWAAGMKHDRTLEIMKACDNPCFGLDWALHLWLQSRPKAPRPLDQLARIRFSYLPAADKVALRLLCRRLELPLRDVIEMQRSGTFQRLRFVVACAHFTRALQRCFLLPLIEKLNNLIQ